MIKASELIINSDGSIFHLHLKPENISDTIILVGDPGRVEMVASKFEEIDFTISNREFVTTTGYFNKRRITVLSTGIGTDNIDIVVNELDALANINLQTRKIKNVHKQLKLIRIGTSGGLQENIPVNSFIRTKVSLGFDGLLHYYANRENVCDTDLEETFKKHVSWNIFLSSPYAVACSTQLADKFEQNGFIDGITISAPGFYGPQGRKLRLPLADPELNSLIEKFTHNTLKITNFEMESSAIYGLSKMLGHDALTICLVIANRVTGDANENYYDKMDELINLVLNRLTENSV